MARLLGFDFGFIDFLGGWPDSQSSPDAPMPNYMSTPDGDPLGDFKMSTGPMNQAPDLVDSRQFRITEGTVTGKDPKVRRGNSTF